MALYATDNRYPGINIHLNHWLQHEAGEWESFHAEHVPHIGEVIAAQLPSGYYVRTERLLQISQFDTRTGQQSQTRQKPDVAVYQINQPTPIAGQAKPSSLEPAVATATYARPDTLPDFDALKGITIYHVVSDEKRGTPVTRLELLSPANKPRASHHPIYSLKRREALESGLNLIEIDYLHTTPPIIATVPSYPDDVNAPAFRVLVSDPHPTLAQGQTALYGWNILDPLPIIRIPLANGDSALMDLQRAYALTFSRNPFYAALVDYAQDPIALNTLRDDDQQHIQNWLERLRQQIN